MASDLTGLKPYGETLKIAVEKTFQGVEAFLSATCKPALDELGMMLRDQVRVWRLNNALKIIEKAKGKFEYKDGEIHLSANPKVALSIIENGSDEENEELQEMWAGLFATSFSENGKDDENLMYVSILKQMTLAEAKLLKHLCEKSKKNLHPNDIVIAQNTSMYGDEIASLTGISDFNKQEVLLNHMGGLKLTEMKHTISHSGWRNPSFNSKPLAWMSATNLALHLYIRCTGFRGSVQEYWNVQPIQKKS